MNDPGVVLASLILGQLIITAVLLSVIAAARAWTGRASGADARTVMAHVLRRIYSRLPHRQSAEWPPSGSRDATSQPGRRSGASTPRSVMFPVPSHGGLPVSRPGSDDSVVRVETAHAWHERLARTSRLVSLPVTSLAGLPISRPVLEGWLGRRKRGKGAARSRAVRRIASGKCPACRANRERGRNYCLDCGRRLTPFLP